MLIVNMIDHDDDLLEVNIYAWYNVDVKQMNISENILISSLYYFIKNILSVWINL